MGLYEQMRSFFGPLHLLSLGQYLVHRRLHKAHRHLFAVALALEVAQE